MKIAAPADTSPQHAQRDALGVLHAPIVNPADAAASKAEALHTYGQYLVSCMPKFIQQFSVWKDELCLYVAPTALIPVMTFLKYHTAAEYTQISDITAVDYPTRDARFEVVYNLLSVRHNSRIRVKTYADEASPVPSVVPLYEGANWYEREVYDLFGVFFTNHPDLRRIMTDYGFDGHPLRKDFPLTGYTEIRYDEEKKRIVVEPLEMTQAFRNFEVIMQIIGLFELWLIQRFRVEVLRGNRLGPVLTGHQTASNYQSPSLNHRRRVSRRNRIKQCTQISNA